MITRRLLSVTFYVRCLSGSLSCLRFLLSAVAVLWRKLVGLICASAQTTGIMLSDTNQ